MKPKQEPPARYQIYRWNGKTREPVEQPYESAVLASLRCLELACEQPNAKFFKLMVAAPQYKTGSGNT